MEFQSRQPDEIFQNLKQKFSGQRPKGFWFPLLIGIAILSIFLNGAGLSPNPFYTIQPDEVGVVLRFGKFIKATNPGLHFKYPLIERVIPVKVEKVYTEEFGFRTQSPGVRTVYSPKSFDDESLMLTGDLNVLDLEWIVQYKISDPFGALFNIRKLVKAIRDVSESVVRRLVGDHSFNEVLTTERIEINNQIQDEMQEILDSYNCGIQIVKVKLQDVNPPDPVKPAFNEVNQAKQEREKLKNQAWEVYNQKIPQAKGEALKLFQEAEGYATEKVNWAKGDAERFLLLYKEYTKAKDVTLKRLYLENMSQILKKAGKKYILDPKEKGILPLLKLESQNE
ncbi:MAG: FtsH protease activity modulator HflK [Candidatus Omnitrophica bacterium]|nr:FtsH protease activity modulator HflK [Candidatus Omnitrophota bacterium]